MGRFGILSKYPLLSFVGLAGPEEDYEAFLVVYVSLTRKSGAITTEEIEAAKGLAFSLVEQGEALGTERWKDVKKKITELIGLYNTQVQNPLVKQSESGAWDTTREKYVLPLLQSFFEKAAIPARLPATDTKYNEMAAVYTALKNYWSFLTIPEQDSVEGVRRNFSSYNQQWKKDWNSAVETLKKIFRGNVYSDQIKAEIEELYKFVTNDINPEFSEIRYINNLYQAYLDEEIPRRISLFESFCSAQPFTITGQNAVYAQYRTFNLSKLSTDQKALLQDILNRWVLSYTAANAIVNADSGVVNEAEQPIVDDALDTSLYYQDTGTETTSETATSAAATTTTTTSKKVLTVLAAAAAILYFASSSK